MTTTQRRGPGARADEHHPTRIELLDAALALAADGGMESLSVSAITSAAGHAKGTFYVHFADRTALLSAIHRRFHDQLFTHIEQVTAPLPAGRARFDARLLAFLDGCRARPGVRAMLREAHAVPQIAELVRERNEQAAAILAVDLRGLVPDEAATATLMVSATVEVAVRELEAGSSLPELRAALLTLVPG